MQILPAKIRTVNNDLSEMEECLRNNTGKTEELERKISELQNSIKEIKEELRKITDENKKREFENIVSQKSPDELIKTAEKYIKDQNYEYAENLLNAFIEKNPDDIHCGQMMFYKGESLFEQKNYKDAAMEYLNGYKKNPNGSKAADTLYKLALCFKELSKYKESKTTLEKIIKDFPNKTAVVKAAAQELKNFEKNKSK